MDNNSNDYNKDLENFILTREQVLELNKLAEKERRENAIRGYRQSFQSEARYHEIYMDY